MKKIVLVFQLFALSFVIVLVNFFLDEYISLSIIGNYVLKYIVASAIVMLFGFVVGWFNQSNFWMAFVYVGVVLILAYMVDAIKTRKDIEYINSRIKKETPKQ